MFKNSIWPLKGQHVSGFDQLEECVREKRSKFSPIFGRHDSVVFAGQHSDFERGTGEAGAKIHLSRRRKRSSPSPTVRSCEQSSDNFKRCVLKSWPQGVS